MNAGEAERGLLYRGAMVRRVALLGLLALVVAPESAHAHARMPYLERIAFDPHDPDRIVAQFSFGLAVTEDAGASWHWICAEAYGADALWEDPDVVVTDDGSVVVGTYATAMRGARDLCSFEPSAGSIDDTAVIDLALDPEDASRVWAITSRGGGDPDHLQRSDDGGRSFRFVGEGVPALFESIALASSDPSRIYITAMIPASAGAPRRALLYRSDDAGETLSEPIDLGILDSEQMPVVVGVDPTDADRLFVRMKVSPLERYTERLLYSEDGGATFASVLELHQMRGFAIAADGQTVWVGSAVGDGVWIAEGGTLAFTQIDRLDVRCLAVRGEELWMCVDQLTSRFAIGRSMDRGETVDAALFLDELIELPECPTCSDTGASCPVWIDDLRLDWERAFGVDAGPTTDASFPLECLDARTTELDAGTRPMDAGARFDAGTEPPPAAGCGCSAAGSGDGSPLLLALFALVVRRWRSTAPRRGGC